MRPIWKGTISFSLVNIPISVYSATRRDDLSFRLLRKKDLSPIIRKLLFAAKVGTGFDERTLRDLYARFQKLRRPDRPFANLPEKASLHSAALTRAEMRRCTWLEPKLVGEVRFAQWTRDGHLRQPAFLGLRDDKSPKEVTRERLRSPDNLVRAGR